MTLLPSEDYKRLKFLHLKRITFFDPFEGDYAFEDS